MGFLNGLSQASPAAAQAAAPGGAGGILENEFDKSFGAGMIPKYGDEPLDIAQPDIMRDNVLRRLMEAPNGGQNLSEPEAPQRERSSGRRSVLDIIGRLADTVAHVGGADPLYQAGVTGDLQRQREQEQQGWQEKFNQQKYASGQNELSETDLTRSAQAARGLAAVYQQGGAPAATKAFPVLARHLGLSPQQTELWTRSLADDPEGTIAALNAATTAPNNASQPAQVQLYNLLNKEDPALGAAYLKRLATPDAELTAYQREQLRDKDRDFDYRSRTGERDFRERVRQFDNKPAPGKAGNSAAMAEQGMADLQNVVTDLRSNYDRLRSGGAMVRQGGSPATNIRARVRASGLGQLVEGAVGTEAQTYRDNITNSRPALVQAIAKATGMSAKQLDSNADMKLALSQATDPSQSFETNQAALARIERFITNRAAAPAPARTPARRPAPRRSGGNGAGSGGWKVIGVN